VKEGSALPLSGKGGSCKGWVNLSKRGKQKKKKGREKKKMSKKLVINLMCRSKNHDQGWKKGSLEHLNFRLTEAENVELFG